MVNLKPESPTLSIRWSMIGFGGLRLVGDVRVIVFFTDLVVLFCLSKESFVEFHGESDKSAEGKKLRLLNINLLSQLNVRFTDSPLIRLQKSERCAVHYNKDLKQGLSAIGMWLHLRTTAEVQGVQFG
jgi:hypothetical protein